jgi:NDP-sugar pyrophosphorylase family protein
LEEALTKMRAILIATGYCEQMDPLLRYRPTPLLNIVDKPIIFHIIETLAKENIHQFDLVLNHLPATIEEKLDDGKRWGVSITYHLAQDPLLPFAPLLPCLDTWKKTPLLLGWGDTLPLFKKNSLKNSDNHSPQLFFYPSDEWSGWAILNTDILKTLNKKNRIEELPSLLHSQPKTIIDRFLSTRSLQDLKTSNSTLLKDPLQQELLPITAHTIAPGIWISRNVSLHPHAELKPPIFIGENCQIENDVQLGPDAIIENHCMVSAGSRIENSIICQRSYVGENLEIEDSIVDRNLLINLSYDTSLHIREDFILSELSPFPFMRYPLSLFARLVAFVLLILFSPLYFYLSFTCRLIKSPMVNLPAPDDSSQWTTFDWLSFESKDSKPLNKLQNYFKRLPLLINILRGETHFIGVVPRGIIGLKQLPTDWQKLYLKSKVGLITLTDLNHSSYPTEDDLYAEETYYSTQMGLWFDIKLFFRWFKNKTLILLRKR